MEATTITAARANLYQLAQKAITSHEPITLTGKVGDVVILSREDYDALQETLYILQTSPDISVEAQQAKKSSKNDLYNRDQLPW